MSNEQLECNAVTGKKGKLGAGKNGWINRMDQTVIITVVCYLGKPSGSVRSPVGMLDIERGVHVGHGPLLLSSALPALASQPDRDRVVTAPMTVTKRSQLPEATFRSPTATVPLGTTTAGSKLPACFLSASLLLG
jgi:hypothetical protein